MYRSIRRTFVAVAAGGTALATFGVTGASVSGAATQTPRWRVSAGVTSAHMAVTPGAQLWVTRYNGPGNSGDGAASVAASPDGRTVFVTGTSAGKTTGEDYATIGYSAATGAQLWVKRYNGPGNGNDEAHSAAVSPNGRTVFVTGASTGKTTGEDYATIAYSAATGAQLWAKRYSGPGARLDTAAAVAVSPSGRTVFVTGLSTTATSAGGNDYATIAYSAATGAQLWVKRYNGPANGSDGANSVAVSGDGTKVFVTGFSAGRGGVANYDYATIGYNAATGAQLWVKRYNGPGNGGDGASSVAASPDGRTVFVTGASAGKTSSEDYATIAYGAATGAQLWVKCYNGPLNRADFAKAVAVSPSGRTVFVTGVTGGEVSSPDMDYATIAYSAATGAQLWAKRYNGPANGPDGALAAAVSPRGRAVYVTGASAVTRYPGPGQPFPYADYATVAYNTATGAQLWAKRYNGPGNRDDGATSVAVNPTGSTVFVTGSSTGKTSGTDYATIAYGG